MVMKVDARRRYSLRFECGTVLDLGRTTLRAARRRARAEAHVGWEDRGSTLWVDVAIQDASGAILETITEAVHPEEPKCTEFPEHRWQDAGVHGNGGGVILRSRCACGVEQTTDTWSMRPDTGEQGLTSISYSTREEV